MPDYNEAQITGRRWTRACRVILENPLGGEGRAATFVEESALEIEGSTITTPAGNLVEPFSADESFDLVHPATGAVIGNATYSSLYVMLHSAYLHVAAKRDARMAAAAEGAGEE